MKKSFGARRVPRKIGVDEPDEEERDGDPESTLKRPTSKPRKSSSLRTAFGPTSVEDEEPESAGIVTPKRSNLSRIAIQRNASKRSNLTVSALPGRDLEDEEDGPSYNAASLQQLKASTPSTPKDLQSDVSNSEVEDGVHALDLSSKFGSSLARYQNSSAIPSAAEIAEKKARRARLAKEQAADEYVSLDPSDPELDDADLDENVMRDERGRLVLKPKDKYQNAESRLVRDDEDIMEGFDEFTEADGKILLGRKAEAEAARRKKQEMSAQIAEAEASDSDSNASERQRNEAFEAAQTRHGTYGAREAESHTDDRPRTPPIMTPLPTLDGVIARLRQQVLDMQTARMQKLQEMERLQREKIHLGEEEVRIQKALRETAEKFAALRAEKGVAATTETTPALLTAPGGDRVNDTVSPDTPAETPAETGRLRPVGLGCGGDDDSGFSTDVENMAGGRSGLGFGLSGRGFDSLGTSAAGSPMHEDDSG